MPHARVAAGQVVDQVSTHDRPAQARSVHDGVIQFARRGHAFVNHVQDLAPDRLLQSIGEMAGHFAAYAQRVHADVGHESAGGVQGGRGGLFAADQLHQRQQVHRIEWMCDQEALRRMHVTLQVRGQQARGTGGNHNIRRRVSADGGQHTLLELELFGDVFLDKVRLPRHRVQVGREGQRPLARQRRKRQPRQRPFGVGNRAPDPLLHLRIEVRGDHVDPEMQRASGPATADDPGTQKTQRPDLSHDRAPFLTTRTSACRLAAPAAARPAARF